MNSILKVSQIHHMDQNPSSLAWQVFLYLAEVELAPSFRLYAAGSALSPTKNATKGALAPGICDGCVLLANISHLNLRRTPLRCVVGPPVSQPRCGLHYPSACFLAFSWPLTLVQPLNCQLSQSSPQPFFARPSRQDLYRNSK